MKQLFYLFSLLIIAACGENNPTGIVHMLCDAENKAHMRGGTYFVNGDYVIANGQTQSDLESYSGKHSCLVTKENQYGMSVKFRNVKRGDRFEVSVMRKSRKGDGMLSAGSQGAFYWSHRGVTAYDNGWKRLRLEFVIDTVNAQKEVDILVWMPGNDSAFFDDLHIIYAPAAAPIQKAFICSDADEDVKEYLFIGHLYATKPPYNRVDYRIELMDKSCFEQIWLGGDVCVRTTLEDETLNYLDDLFDLSKPANYWALGNHDVMYKHPERIEKRTHRNSWYAHYNNGFTVLVINTSLDKLYSRDALCAERKQQFEMIKNVCDTIVKSTHLVLLMHHVLWFEIDTKYWIYTNELKSSWRATCDSASTFKNAVYPLLQAVQQKGIQVLCIAGDVGLKKKKHGSYRSDEGIQFLACGLGDGHYYREQKDSIHNDQVLILRHNLRDSSLSWGFHNLDSLLGEQLVLY